MKNSPKKKGKSGKHARTASGGPNEKEVETFKNIVRDYNRTKIQVDPRDFRSDLPILTALGVDNYDKISNLDYLQVQLEEALKKWVKDWKTIDTSRINYLMKYGIVQEVMKIEERKSVRREAALRPSPTKQRDDSENTPRGQKSLHSPILGSPGKKNKDL